MAHSGRVNGLEKDGDSGLTKLGCLEMLAQDPRPTFILDIAVSRQASQPAPIVYRNPALQSQFTLNELVSGRVVGHTDLSYIGFRDWTSHHELRENHWSPQTRRCFGGISWAGYTVRSRYRIISGHPEDENALQRDASVNEVEEEETWSSPSEARMMQRSPDPLRREEKDGADTTSVTSTERYAYGCTDLSVAENRFTPFVQFFRSVDWGATVLGNMGSWPLQLHQMCNFLMNDPTPAYVLWGTDLIVLYNEAAIQVLLDRHPRCMGLPLQEVYPEVWSQV
jgi:hypothetical protein